MPIGCGGVFSSSLRFYSVAVSHCIAQILFADNYGKFSILPLVQDIFGMYLRINESIFSHTGFLVLRQQFQCFFPHISTKLKTKPIHQRFFAVVVIIPSSFFVAEHASKWQNIHKVEQRTTNKNMKFILRDQRNIDSIKLNCGQTKKNTATHKRSRI